MSVPKKKISRTRTRSRRSHHALAAVAVTKCVQCGYAKLPHRVCSHCGFYRGKNVLNLQARVERKLDKKAKADQAE